VFFFALGSETNAAL